MNTNNLQNEDISSQGSVERVRRLARARTIAAEAAPRVRARRDYDSDNMFAVAHRQAELREIGIRVMAAESSRLGESATLSRRIVESVRLRSSLSLAE
jgi:hypothetical protein